MEINPELISEINKALESLGAPMGLLCAVGSIGDTLTDDEVLEMLRAYNTGEDMMKEVYTESDDAILFDAGQASKRSHGGKMDNKLVEAAEAAIGALESYCDRKEGRGENTDGLKSILKFLKEEVNKAKAMVKIGHHHLSSVDLYRRIVDKLSHEQFRDIVKQIETELDKEKS